MIRVCAVALLLISFVSVALADGPGGPPVGGTSTQPPPQVIAN
jgi:hypothetical protein